jgi:hypothetical protein
MTTFAAFFGEEQRNGLAYTGSPSGDDSNLVLELHDFLPPSHL